MQAEDRHIETQKRCIHVRPSALFQSHNFVISSTHLHLKALGGNFDENCPTSANLLTIPSSPLAAAAIAIASCILWKSKHWKLREYIRSTCLAANENVSTVVQSSLNCHFSVQTRPSISIALLSVVQWESICLVSKNTTGLKLSISELWLTFINSSPLCWSSSAFLTTGRA